MNHQIPNPDQLIALAKENPDQLEKMRQNWVNELIESAPEEIRRRLRGLQFQIDCQRTLHDSPMGACLEISKMMYESLNSLNRLMNGGAEVSAQTNLEPATVLAFPSAS